MDHYQSARTCFCLGERGASHLPRRPCDYRSALGCIDQRAEGLQGKAASVGNPMISSILQISIALRRLDIYSRSAKRKKFFGLVGNLEKKVFDVGLDPRPSGPAAIPLDLQAGVNPELRRDAGGAQHSPILASEELSTAPSRGEEDGGLHALKAGKRSWGGSREVYRTAARSPRHLCRRRGEEWVGVRLTTGPRLESIQGSGRESEFNSLTSTTGLSGSIVGACRQAEAGARPLPTLFPRTKQMSPAL